MAVRVLVFDPTKECSIEAFEQQLDSYLGDGWEILHALAGNRSGFVEGVRTVRNASKLLSPEHKDYVLFVLRNVGLDQPQPAPHKSQQVSQ
jgi:hypothetical protein